MDDIKGMITDIQGFSTDNGPRIRTTVFMKGCNLRCPWCHNPETLLSMPQLLFYAARCRHCGRCVSLCPHACHSDDGNSHTFHRLSCTSCGACASGCRADALAIAGKKVGVGDILPRIVADQAYYDMSGGGLTLSGGEPLLQAAFCAELAKRCAAQGIQTLIDTAACVSYRHFETVLPYIREFYVDLKCPDESSYRRYTGGSLKIVLDNLRRLSDAEAAITIRIPIIPHINDDPVSCRRMANYLNGIAIKEIHLLPFHKLGSSKYKALGLDYSYSKYPAYSPENLVPLLDSFQPYPVSIAG